MKQQEAWKEERERGISKMIGLLKFITCGSVDDGKSTLIGHILYDSKLLYIDQEEALELDSKVGSRGGKIDYSLLLDGLMAEREQGITIDVAYRYFTTEKRSFIVADTPGHEEYTRNMAVGASFADLAVILIDASQGVLVQTRRHARICALMGIRHFVFAVNKMDLVKYDQETFRKIEEQIKELQEELSLANVKIIPVSATEGDNVTTKSDNIPWYTGEPLLEYLETVDVREKSEEEGFYMPVQRVCRPNHTFRGFQGQIESGQISVGDEIVTLPSKEHAKVKSLLIGDKDAQTAEKGRPVTIQLDREVDVSRGCVLANKTELPVSKSFTATVLWMDDGELLPGKEYFVKIGTKEIPGIVTNIQYKIDVNTGEYIPANNPVSVVLADAAQSDVVPQGLGEVLGTLLTNFVANPVSSLMSGNYIGILFWACMFGLAMKNIGSDTTKKFLADTADAVSQVVRWIINLAPFGIMGLVYTNVAGNGLAIFTQYGKLLALLVGTMLFMALIVSPFIIFLYLRCNPYPLVFRCLKESGLTAFFTRSSA